MAENGAFRIASAVLPVFNGAATLESCLTSLSSQSPALKEILVIDDGSSDDTWSILESFARREPRLVIRRHRQNRGLSRTLNEAISSATGDAVLVIHVDCELIGTDWIERGLAALQARPHTCLTGRPIYPYAEFSSVETAFGLLRDTFYAPDEPEETLGFSEFKCDLVPRKALQGAPFDERFRVSGEDQVLSTRLAELGYSIVRRGGMAYRQRFGNVSSVRSQLRKEIAYGRTEGGVLIETSLRVTHESVGSRTSKRRLVNRASALMVPLAFLFTIVLLALRIDAQVAVLPLLLTLPRIALVVRRWRDLPRETRARRRAGALALALIPLNDVLYGAALVLGLLGFAALRRV